MVVVIVLVIVLLIPLCTFGCECLRENKDQTARHPTQLAPQQGSIGAGCFEFYRQKVAGIAVSVALQPPAALALAGVSSALQTIPQDNEAK